MMASHAILFASTGLIQSEQNNKRGIQHNTAASFDLLMLVVHNRGHAVWHCQLFGRVY